MVRAVVIRPPQHWLDERRASGADRWDELWEGELHMVPPPSDAHQRLGTDLLCALRPLVDALGWVITYETGVFRPGTDERDYRVPDLVVSRSEARTARGVEGSPELVVEIVSPDDETRAKLAFYVSMGTREVWILDRIAGTAEVLVAVSDALVQVARGADGVAASTVLPVGWRHEATGVALVGKGVTLTMQRR